MGTGRDELVLTSRRVCRFLGELNLYKKSVTAVPRKELSLVPSAAKQLPFAVTPLHMTAPKGRKN